VGRGALFSGPDQRARVLMGRSKFSIQTTSCRRICQIPGPSCAFPTRSSNANFQKKASKPQARLCPIHARERRVGQQFIWNRGCRFLPAPSANSRRHFLFGSRMVDDGSDKKQRAASSSTPENFRHFAEPHHHNRKAEYQGQHDDPRARLPIAKQSGQKCQRRDYG
jgi:hypothetical protein